MDPVPALLFVGSIVILVGAIALDHVLVQRRRHSVQECAARLGLSYEAKAAPFADSDVSGLWFLDQGASTVTHNVLRASGGAMVVFDLTLFNPTEIAVETTFAAFRCPRGKLPVFQLGAKHLLERAREVVANQSMALDDPAFNRDFYVHSADASLRAFLSADKLALVRQHARDFRLATSPDWLVVYRSGVKVRARDLAPFIAAARTIAAGLLNRAPEVPQPATVG